MNTLMKWVSGAMALLFIFWAAFQYNDPDPFMWVFVYGLASLASVLFLIKRLPLAFPLAFCLIGVCWAIYLSTVITYEPPLIAIEEWREMMGLVVISSWMGFLTWTLRKSKQANLEEARSG